MKHLSAYELAAAAAAFALMAALSFAPFVFLLPVLFVCCTRGLRLSLLSGLFFGLLSMALSFMGTSPLSYAFMQAPWIPVAARVLGAGLTWGAGRLFAFLFRKTPEKRRYLRYGLTAAAGSLFNTLLVGGAVLLFAPVAAGREGDIILSAVLPAIIALNAPIELAVNTLVVPLLCMAVTKMEGRLPKRRDGADR
ncbi:MAG: hypothetical protein LBH24_03350 [Clostridiales bacterium]|nr:hypothetical protein [Clostridiales bacterium]